MINCFNLTVLKFICIRKSINCKLVRKLLNIDHKQIKLKLSVYTEISMQLNCYSRK